MTTQTYIASDGDTADYIAWRVYGTQGARVVEQLLSANPHLADAGPTLTAGTVVNLPDLNTTPQLAGVRLWD